MKLNSYPEQLLFSCRPGTRGDKLLKPCGCFSGQTVRLDSGTLAQEERRVPPAHAQERREQRGAQGPFSVCLHVVSVFI